MPKLSIRDLDLANKRVLIRVDFNVPLKDGVITDDTRIRETLPTIEYALRRKARVILASHLGRPKGKPVESMSLRPIVDHLRHLLLLDTRVQPGNPCDSTAKRNAADEPKGETLDVLHVRPNARVERPTAAPSGARTAQNSGRAGRAPKLSVSRAARTRS